MYQEARPRASPWCSEVSSRPPFGPVVAERQVHEGLRAQAAQLDADLVEPVPAHARLERLDVGEALPRGRRAWRPTRCSRPSCAATHAPSSLLVAGAAGDREPVVVGEARHQALEVVGVERHVGVHLDHHVDGLRQRAGAAQEAVEVARTAAAVGERLVGDRPRRGSAGAPSRARRRARPARRPCRRWSRRRRPPTRPAGASGRPARPTAAAGSPPRCAPGWRRRSAGGSCGGAHGRRAPAPAAGSRSSHSSSITSASSRFACSRAPAAPLGARPRATTRGSTTAA